jgi:hypothetical protein
LPLSAWKDGVDPPSWWTMPAPVVGAANTFDSQHRAIRTQAHALLTSPTYDPGSVYQGYVFRNRLHEVSAHRYVAPPLAADQTKDDGKWRKKHRAPPNKPSEPKERKSIWEPRRSWCDAKDIFDHEVVKGHRFELDWQEASDNLSLAAVIVKFDEDDGDAKQVKQKKKQRLSAVELGEAGMCEVHETEAVMRRNYDTVYHVFSFYAIMHGEDLFGLSLNEWTQCAAPPQRALHTHSRAVAHMCPHSLRSCLQRPRGGCAGSATTSNSQTASTAAVAAEACWTACFCQSTP